jgi:hypothetical protein
VWITSTPLFDSLCSRTVKSFISKGSLLWTWWISRKWVDGASRALTAGTVGDVLSPLLHTLWVWCLCTVALFAFTPSKLRKHLEGSLEETEMYSVVPRTDHRSNGWQDGFDHILVNRKVPPPPTNVVSCFCIGLSNLLYVQLVFLSSPSSYQPSSSVGCVFFLLIL